PLEIGSIQPTPELVDQYFNDSTDEDGDGSTDMAGSWLGKEGFKRVDSPAFHPELMAVDGPN
ncbi:hypothetical protein, partial [Gluconacetobacter tumulisoli]